MTTYYRPKPKDKLGGATYALDELGRAKLAMQPINNEDDIDSEKWARRFGIYGEWYCQNEDCNVRTVQINAKWPGGDRPAMPEFKCPQCGRGPLKFHNFLDVEVLVAEEIDGGATA